ncbi:MAG: DNA-binding protein [Planctomycetota bacterium]|nr:MAG: DNA-binding protein [Planctomycetota bacterium]
MDNTNTPETFLPLRRAAARLGVPAAWLRAEAHAGRVPHLRVGRRLLFNTAAVEAVLSDRAAREAKRAAQANE